MNKLNAIKITIILLALTISCNKEVKDEEIQTIENEENEIIENEENCLVSTIDNGIITYEY